ncbi:MAG: hypothetical protein E7058_03130 [Lentisphaerae bacterium]|nr:hypothetical protein [Lentisphaerota bacterium]
MKKTLLALDIGNVCVRIDPPGFAAKYGWERLPAELSQLLMQYETGIIRDEAAFLQQAAAFFQNRYPAEYIKQTFNQILVEPVPGMEELAGDFENMGVTAIFFSDISPTHLARTRELFSTFDRISGGIFSFESGGLKPSDRMFDRFEKLHGTPDLYVDDRADLINAAKERGWNAEIFVSAEDLRKKLRLLS